MHLLIFCAIYDTNTLIADFKAVHWCNLYRLSAAAHQSSTASVRWHQGFSSEQRCIVS